MVDVSMLMLERLAIERAKELFGAEHANVQLFRAQANMAVFLLFKPGIPRE